MAQLIQFCTSDGLTLTGLLHDVQSPRAAIVHVHGNTGNFYENVFLQHLARIYAANSIALFAFNNRGHDAVAEGYQDAHVTYVGSAFEDLSAADLDVEAAVSVCQKLITRNVILQGHSFGCAKVLGFASRSPVPIDVILLSPADSLALQAGYIAPETLHDQSERLRSAVDDHAFQLLAPSEFGVRNRGKEYPIPISRRTLLQLLDSQDLRLFSFATPPASSITGRGFVYVGGADPLQTATPDDVQGHFAACIPKLEFNFVRNGDHHFTGLESALATAIVEWVLRLPRLAPAL